MIKAILFDSWGTLIENGIFPSPSKQVKYILGVEGPFHEFVQRFEEVFMLKQYDNLADAFKAVCREFDVDEREFVIDKLIGMWNKNMLLAKLYPETVDMLEKLRKKYKLALVANTDPFSMDSVLEKFELRKHFIVMGLSYEYGTLKTNPKMFETILNKLKVSKDEAIMVGDGMESDIRAAEKAGIKAVLMDRRDKRDYPNKIASLEELEKFL